MEPELAIIEFEDADEAVEYAKELNANSKTYEIIYSIAPDEPWLFMIGICDICTAKSLTFIPAVAFEDGIIACECCECENMSVYPKELEPEDGDEL